MLVEDFFVNLIVNQSAIRNAYRVPVMSILVRIIRDVLVKNTLHHRGVWSILSELMRG